MRKIVAFGMAAATLLMMSSYAAPALAINHGCTPPTGDIDDISIDVVLDGKRGQASGSFCSAVGKAEAMIERSRLSPREKRAAHETLMQLQLAVETQGRAAAGKKVSGSVGCTGNVSTGRSGNKASGSCGFQINF